MMVIFNYMYLFDFLYLIGGIHDHDGHMKIGLWVLAGILSFLIIEKVFAKEGEFEHVSQKLMYECLIYAFLEDQDWFRKHSEFFKCNKIRTRFSLMLISLPRKPKQQDIRGCTFETFNEFLKIMPIPTF